MEPRLEAVSYYDPPNMTYPFGAYVCVVGVDVDSGVTEVRRFYALDDCGTRINPMIVEGQVHGGLTEALAIALGQEMDYDEFGNLRNASLLDFFLPTAVETPNWETDYTTTPSPHHPIGAKGVGESPNVGGVSAFSNAVNDAFAHLGLTHMPMPHDHWRVFFFFKDTATTEIYTLSLHDALPISPASSGVWVRIRASTSTPPTPRSRSERSEEHTSELQSLRHLVCRLLLEKK